MPQLITNAMGACGYASSQPQGQKKCPAAAGAATKVTKVRRARQSRNPQLSVARRNERERNRVKMVNNGFALLRDHLPAEYLALVNGGGGGATTTSGGSSQGRESESGCDTPDVSSAGGGTKSPSPSAAGGKTKKFSKVETLRAAIQHIRMLEELIRESEPTFESININNRNSQDQQQQQQQVAYEVELENPASIVSSSSQSNQPMGGSQASFQVQYQQRLAQHEQFVKLEPSASQTIQFQQQQQQHSLSPFETAQTTVASASSPCSTQAAAYEQEAQQAQGQQQPNQLEAQAGEQNFVADHTHLWIQQHQSSFMEQQQQQQFNWSPYQHPYQTHEQHLEQASPVDSSSTHFHHNHQQGQMQFQQQQHHHHQTEMAENQGQQQQVDSPPQMAHWFAPSPTSQTIIQQQVAAAASSSFGQSHQISLYSQ